MADDARAAVLARVRRALGRAGPLAGEPRAAVERRLAEPPPGIIPARAHGLELEDRIRLFTAQAKAVAGDVRRLDRLAELPGAVAGYLRAHNLPRRVVMAPDLLLERAGGWGPAMVEVRRGAADPADEVGLAAAFAGVAETGTLMLVSGPDNPVLLGFLPETSIVVLPAERLVGTYEEAWHWLRAAYGAALPRSVNLITGPSRSGDIEQTLQLGAHGPRRLLTVIVDEPAS